MCCKVLITLFLIMLSMSSICIRAVPNIHGIHPNLDQNPKYGASRKKLIDYFPIIKSYSKKRKPKAKTLFLIINIFVIFFFNSWFSFNRMMKVDIFSKKYEHLMFSVTLAKRGVITESSFGMENTKGSGA